MPPRPLECVPFEHVFLPPWTQHGARPWNTDAHFCTYTVHDPSQQPGTEVWMRCNKPVLKELRERGCDLLTTMLVFDYDNLGHRKWNPGEVQAFATYLQERQRAGFWLGMHWTVFYTTTHGARLVYVLSRPVPVEQSEPLAAGIIRDFLSQGLRLDPNCVDWTRLFRAPYVARKFEKGKQGQPGYLTWRENSWEDPNFQTHCFPENRLDPSWIVPGEVRPQSEAIAAEELDLPKPAHDVVRLLKEINPSSGREVYTGWWKSARAALNGRDCYPCIFEDKPIAAPGGRDTTIHSFVGLACTLLGRIEGSQPELIYALFLPAVLLLEPDAQTPDWTDVLWKAVLRYWAKEEARRKQERAEADAVVEASQTLGSKVLAGMRVWCAHPGLHNSNDAEALAWMGEHLIACCGNYYYVMGPSGRYDNMPVPQTQLIARVRALGMETLIPIRSLKSDGEGYRTVTAAELVNAHGTIVGRIEGAAGGDGSHIRNIDTEDSALVVRLYARRTDLMPEFNHDINHWLKLLFGSNYERCIEWLSHALAIEDGPICALSIHGAPGCGKQMLALGLGECFTQEAVAGGEEFGKYQSGLMQTPIICVNEGFTRDRDGRDVADAFRALVSGDPVQINEKFKPRVTIRVPVRILITANDDDAVNILTGHKDLTEFGREAIAVRLIHIKTNSDARLWLIGKGGLTYTSMPGKRWVRPQNGGESNYLLAKHILYLYENRRPPMRGQRLLVEGLVDSDVEKLIRTRSGSAPEIIETVVTMIESTTPGIEGLHIDTTAATVHVTSSGVMKYHRALRHQMGGRTIGQKAFSSVLKSLVMPGDPDYPRVLKLVNGPSSMLARWHELDLRVLLTEAITLGYRCEKLSKLVATRFALNPYVGQAVQAIAERMGVKP